MKMQAAALLDPRAVTAAERVLYSPAPVPDPRTTRQPDGGLVRAVRFSRLYVGNELATWVWRSQVQA